MQRSLVHKFMSAFIASGLAANRPAKIRQKKVQTPEQREVALGLAKTRREIRNAKRLRSHKESLAGQSSWIPTPHWQL